MIIARMKDQGIVPNDVTARSYIVCAPATTGAFLFLCREHAFVAWQTELHRPPQPETLNPMPYSLLPKPP